MGTKVTIILVIATLVADALNVFINCIFQINFSTHHYSCCRHPAYSINGILGIPQATSDANDNLLKRKREDDEDTRGEEVE